LLGAFIPGVAVQPVCIRYHYRHVSFLRFHALLFDISGAVIVETF